jgi:uncharacterized membrane protein YeaQ/YmgE (transglycosylase-associated protein family)
MTLETFAASLAVGLVGGWLAGIVRRDGGYGLLGDLSLGLAGSTGAVWIVQAVGLFPDAGMAGTMLAAFAGTAAVVVAQRTLWCAQP